MARAVLTTRLLVNIKFIELVILFYLRWQRTAASVYQNELNNQIISMYPLLGFSHGLVHTRQSYINFLHMASCFAHSHEIG